MAAEPIATVAARSVRVYVEPSRGAVALAGASRQPRSVRVRNTDKSLRRFLFYSQECLNGDFKALAPDPAPLYWTGLPRFCRAQHFELSSEEPVLV